ncbi:MAG: hypothetical protein K0S41_2700 [Anaerocolumna sp.]|jgi:glycopeptide antibiotics resistance protein|nr:hypothetical protein [Anaerocolumna sp.]
MVIFIDKVRKDWKTPMGQVIFKDIIVAMISYLPLALIIGIIWVAIYCVLYNLINIDKDLVSRMKGLDIKILVCVFILIIYIVFIIAITLLSRESGSRTQVNLKLFGTLTHDIYGNAYVVENIILFIPLGMLLPLLSSKFESYQFCLISGLFASIIIEVTQYITKRGYLQTDDIIMNVLGTVVGFFIYNILKVILKALVRLNDSSNKT